MLETQSHAGHFCRRTLPQAACISFIHMLCHVCMACIGRTEVSPSMKMTGTCHPRSTCQHKRKHQHVLSSIPCQSLRCLSMWVSTNLPQALHLAEAVFSGDQALACHDLQKDTLFAVMSLHADNKHVWGHATQDVSTNQMQAHFAGDINMCVLWLFVQLA